MSAFGSIATESADSENQNQQTAMPEDETATSELAEATAEHNEVAAEDDTAEQLGEEQEQVEDLGETIAEESAGLTPRAARLLNISLSRIVGAKRANKIIATENYSSSRSAQEDAKQIALEGIKDTLKQFWEAIKAQLKKFYNKVKTFFVKIFSAARKLSERAKKLQDKANSTVGSIEEKSFSFSQTKAIAVEGKYNEPGKLTSSLNTLQEVIKGTITEMKKDTVDAKIDDAVDAIKASFTGSGKNRSLNTQTINALQDAVKGTVKGAKAAATNAAIVGDKTKYDAQFGDANEVTVTGVFGLPGGRAIIVVEPKIAASDLKTAIKVLKGAKLVMASDRYNPRDVSEGDVKTLTTSQIDKVCDDVIEIAESVYSFEKNWKENDKYVEKIQREVDDIVKEFDSEDEAESTEQREFRNFCTSAVGAIRRHTQFKANLCQYDLTTGNAFLNYAERSLAQHKSK